MPLLLTTPSEALTSRWRVTPRLPCLPPARTIGYPARAVAKASDRHHHGKAKAVDEQQLITACRALDRDAQRRVYDLTVERVYRLIHRMVHNADDAFDLTQEVYVRIFTRMHRFRADCSLATWIHRIAVNETLAFMRRNRTEDRYRRDLAGSDRDRAVDSKPADQRMDVRAALDELAEQDRMILLLRYDQGLDYRSIAQLLECAEGTVASRLGRARQRLRMLLATACAGPEENQPLAHPNDGRARFGLSGAEASDPDAPTFSGQHKAPADGERS